MLSDIRWDIDELISSDPDSSLLVINLDREAEFTDERPGPLELMRGAYPIEVTSEPTAPTDRPTRRRGIPATSTLLTNLGFADLRALSSNLDGPRRLLGFRGRSAIGCCSDLWLRRLRSSGGLQGQHR